MKMEAKSSPLQRLRTRLLALLRLPSEPEVMQGDTGIHIFRASLRYYRYRLALWSIVQCGIFLGLGVGIVVLSAAFRAAAGGRQIALILALILLAWTIYLLQLLISFLLIRIDYRMRWYLISDRSLRVREGVLLLHEKTMTFSNVQQISIRRNPLQRLLGIADLHVRSAGGGATTQAGSAHGSHEVRFRGVENAELIRETIRARLRHDRGAGLGDPDDEAIPKAAAPEAVAAARKVLLEMQELRRTMIG